MSARTKLSTETEPNEPARGMCGDGNISELAYNLNSVFIHKLQGKKLAMSYPDQDSQYQQDSELQTPSSDYYLNQEQQVLDLQFIALPSDQSSQQPQYQAAQQPPQPQYQPAQQPQYQPAQQPPQLQYQSAQQPPQPQYQPAQQLPQQQYQPNQQQSQSQYQPHIQNPQLYQPPHQQPWQYQCNQNPPQYQPAQTLTLPPQYQQYQPGGSYTPRPQNQIIGTEGWNTAFFGCLEDPTNALITACFPCVTFGQIAEIIDNGHSSCATSAALYFGVWFCIAMPCLLSYSYRTKMRSKYNLIETPAPDFLTHCFCEPCALCQEYRELQHRGLDPSIGWQGNLALQQRNYAMTPPMNNSMMH